MVKLSSYEETAKRFELKKGEQFCLKLTTAQGVSGRISWLPPKCRNLLIWGEGVSHSIKNDFIASLGTYGWIHAYSRLDEEILDYSYFLSGFEIKRYGWALWLAKGSIPYRAEFIYKPSTLGFKHLTTLIKIAGGRTHPNLPTDGLCSTTVVRLRNYLSSIGLGDLC